MTDITRTIQADGKDLPADLRRDPEDFHVVFGGIKAQG